MPQNRDESLRINREAWDRISARQHGRTALPRYGPLTQQEDELNLLGDIKGQRVLELGCGTGHSMAFLSQRGASEIWGLDISGEQAAVARSLLAEANIDARVFTSPMEENPGIPLDYFDLVISIYSLGWSVDLDETLQLTSSYLKSGGVFIFSWEHPVFNALDSGKGRVGFARSYCREGAIEGKSWADIPIAMHARKISTFVNGLVDAGMTVRRMIEGEYRPEKGEVHYSHRWFSQEKAETVPTTFIVVAQK